MLKGLIHNVLVQLFPIHQEARSQAELKYCSSGDNDKLQLLYPSNAQSNKDQALHSDESNVCVR